MLIYDHNKEFIGIDQESLKLLGYERFEDLIHEHKDVAELFVKKPGYIHNFTNFPWIDFVLHAESDDAKVIIAGKTKSVSATIEIVPLYLNRAPDEDAFLIKLKNIESYQLDASERPEQAPTPFKVDNKDFISPSETEELSIDPIEQPSIEPQPIVEEAPQQAPLTLDEDIFLSEQENSTSDLENDEELDIFFNDEETPEMEQEQRIEAAPEFPVLEESIFDNIQEEEKSTPMLGAYLTPEDQAYLAELKVDDDYVYDPQIAADELGLPVDLIEEFIGDFIKQAHEFKEQLFTATAESDFDNIKILSHKLKGVAANLRIEDAFELLATVNETDDAKECEANLKKFYLSIAKLEGKDIEEVKQELEKPIDLYELTPKFEQEIEEEIMQPLDLPELQEEKVSEEPVQLDTPYQEQEPLITADDDHDDIYDFGLIDDDTSAPLIVLDDEEEIHSDIQDFEPVESANAVDVLALTYDVAAAASEIGLSADLVSALIDDYIIEANEMESKLNDVIASSDVMRWKGYATQLKGVSDNLRIQDISDVLQSLIASTDATQAKAALQKFYGFINQL